MLLAFFFMAYSLSLMSDYQATTSVSVSSVKRNIHNSVAILNPRQSSVICCYLLSPLRIERKSWLMVVLLFVLSLSISLLNSFVTPKDYSPPPPHYRSEQPDFETSNYSLSHKLGSE